MVALSLETRDASGIALGRLIQEFKYWSGREVREGEK